MLKLVLILIICIVIYLIFNRFAKRVIKHGNDREANRSGPIEMTDRSKKSEDQNLEKP